MHVRSSRATAAAAAMGKQLVCMYVGTSIVFAVCLEQYPDYFTYQQQHYTTSQQQHLPAATHLPVLFTSSISLLEHYAYTNYAANTALSTSVALLITIIEQLAVQY
jgi:hypothetical protein